MTGIPVTKDEFRESILEGLKQRKLNKAIRAEREYRSYVVSRNYRLFLMYNSGNN